MKSICSNCLTESEDVFTVLPDKNYTACKNCSVTYGKNRNGETFLIDERVMLKDFHLKTNGKIFIIKGIYILGECESGRMIYLVEKESGKPLKSVLDCNWLIKLTNNKNLHHGK